MAEGTSDRRGHLGGWLQPGTGATRDADPPAADPLSRNHASLLRRAGALAVDWLGALLLTRLAFGVDDGTGSSGLFTLGVFAVMTALLVGTVGTTIGHRLFALVVQAESGGWAGPGRAVVRTVLLVLVIPAVVWGRDGRALHDRLAGTRIVRR